MATPDELHSLDGFVPCETQWIDGRLIVEWGYLGSHCFTDPFFADTVQRCCTEPLPRLLRLRTPISALEKRQALAPGLPLAGLIFHASRCGSTLISQMLATLPELVVLSEPCPLDAVLRAHMRDPAISDDMRIAWLHWMVSALGQARSGAERRLVLKLDAWSLFALPLIERAFPDVPWVFVYREPAAIIVSHLRRRGMHMVPGMIEAELFGLEASSVATMAAEEYCGRVLGRLGAAAATHFRPERARFIAYEELPAAVETTIARLFALEVTPAALTRLRDVARLNAKDPSRPFADDTKAKRHDTTPAIARAVENWVAPVWARLEALRARK
jgi:gluconate kinase